MSDLEDLFHKLVASACYQDERETLWDKAVIEAIQQRDQDLLSRNRTLVAWLDRYKVLMSYKGIERENVAEQILVFADGRSGDTLDLDASAILSEFQELERKIKSVAPRTKAGEPRDVTSLTSKALWCCYPDHVPIYDRNAVVALGVISRMFNDICSSHTKEGYPEFIEVWFQLYRRVEAVIERADRAACPQKVRVLDRILWHLGQNGFSRQIGDGLSSENVQDHSL